MRKFLIATHGAFAQGIKSSLDVIIGETENLFLIGAYLDQNIAVEDELKPIMDALTAEDELIIFTDLLGGSVNNIMIREALRDNVHIISGFNLPLLIEVILGDADIPIDELIESALLNAKAQLTYVNKLIETQQQNDFD
ncbi:PTS sugar transporter subunit IIA [Mucilaginibacter sp. FT3.2]|uniref:PTS sugar transporter subunit IIA n=1 Tax=Mucilaginibacter sp. FT3.2 TaxID=2723090 RepID=UPI00160C2F98|nr:PTS sugar transporter subunit IIA [Mucilaginibacter sp. FT3.2]MBB6231609.1 mannose/fructose-specific phosphotransferase system component IIA [Mucilaginibacter sp. FT3.2]